MGGKLRRSGDGAAVLVAVKDLPAQTAAAVHRDGLSLPVPVDPHDTVNRAYDLTGVPQTFVLDKDGGIVTVTRGLADARELRADIAKAQDPSAPGPPCAAVRSARTLKAHDRIPDVLRTVSQRQT